MASNQSGHFVWFEYLAKDTKAAIAYYTEVMGWTTQAFGDEYVMWVGSQGPLGGVMALPAEVAALGVPAHWMSHVQVDDVDRTVARAVKMGGKVHKEPTDIPTIGRFSVIADPQGAAISLFKPETAMERHDVQKPGEF